MLVKKDIFWTDYIKDNLFNGIGASFLLSDGSFVMDEIHFKYGWLWRFGNNDIKNTPNYMNDELKRFKFNDKE